MSGLKGIRFRQALRSFCSARCLYLGLGGAIGFGAAPALAQTANAPVNLDLGSVLSTGTGSAADLVSTPGTAPYEAPSKAPLNASQPTSLVTKNTISTLTTGTQSWVDIAKLTPSVSAISPNGPGLQEANGPVLRGFQNGQYNVTFDGIPIGDSNDFTTHSTSFFTNQQIGQMIVDRGPGTASTVGNATFGGTMSIRTIDPTAQRSITPYGEWGSWGTTIGGATLNTGSIQSANGTTAVVDAEHMASNGGKTNTPQERTNFFGKVVIPVNTGTTITLLADYNRLYQSFDTGATSDQIALFGPDYGNNLDPTSQAYYKYNTDHITNDMEYIDLQSSLGDGVLYDGKVYTYGYYHRGLNGLDANGQGLPGEALPTNAVQNLVTYAPNGAQVTGVPGQQMEMDYRSVGTIQRLQKDLSFGDVKVGFWFDHQVNTRFQKEAIMNANNATNYIGGWSGSTYDSTYNPIDRLQHNQLYTFQPYGQFDWKPIDALTLTFGVKYAMFRRALNAPVNQGTGLAQGFDHTWGKALPSFEAQYSFTPNLSAYVQGAEGFLAPNLNTFYIQNLNSTTFKPESTINFQTGMAYQDQHVALSGDLYTIHFQNFMESVGSGANKYYTNVGGAIYRGVEAEAAYSFDFGLTAFANAGYNEAFRTSSNISITQAPQGTANFGLIYDRDGIYASIIDQWTGGEYSGNTGIGTYANSPAGGHSPGGWYDPYNVVNLAAGYTFNHLSQNLNQVKLKLNVDNITNNQKVVFDNGTDAAGQLWYYTLPGVAAFVSISVPINF
ncbi:TonB-dependent receptor [Acidocella aromatica]|uniref:Iron complex outermembrane receptor protein n=1 Tax=Acidocella aromatica TaxID=1303579 RepID=A0A840VPT7_9PROT|nr:TonB-dependent receptor [Acidocella aromatica]MBB5373420.1 iron complex outermembrane receptor protein [Acidocella aromatica]